MEWGEWDRAFAHAEARRQTGDFQRPPERLRAPCQRVFGCVVLQGG